MNTGCVIRRGMTSSINGILFFDRLNAVANRGIRRRVARLMQEREEYDE